MSSYFFGLHFSEKVSRQELQEKINSLPGIKQGPEGPDHYWAGGVHLVFHDEDLEPMIRDIEKYTGQVSGRYSLGVGVHDLTQDSTNQMLEVILALTPTHDFVAIYQSESLMLWQKEGQLTVDSTALSQQTRDYLSARRPCRIDDISQLLEG